MRSRCLQYHFPLSADKSEQLNAVRSFVRMIACLANVPLEDLIANDGNGKLVFTEYLHGFLDCCRYTVASSEDAEMKIILDKANEEKRRVYAVFVANAMNVARAASNAHMAGDVLIATHNQSAKILQHISNV